MKSYPMDLDAVPPYWIDMSEPRYIDEDGFTSEKMYEMPMTNGFLVRRWLDSGVSRAIRNRAVAGRITRQKNTLMVASPAGDLYLRTDQRNGRVSFTRFVTATALVGQAEEYRIYTPEPGEYDAKFTFETTERNGQNITAALDEFYLGDRDPVAVRLVEMVSLIKANATPNVNPYSFMYQQAA